MVDREHWRVILRLLIERFSESELRLLCFDLDVDFDSLQGSQKTEKAIDLLQYVKRHDLSKDFLEICRERRVDVPWPELDSETRPASEPRLVVDPFSPRGFRSVAEALASASPGEIIEVRPGHYRESLVIDKPIVILGAGQPGDVVIDGGAECALAFAAPSGRVENLRLITRGRSTSTVDIAEGRLGLKDCDISGLGSAGVAIRGDAEPRIRNCKIHDGGAYGVFVSDNARGTIEDTEIWGHSVVEVVICSGGDPAFRHTTVRDGRGGGITVYDAGRGLFEYCDIFGTALALVSISKGGDPILRWNQIHGGSQNGVYVYDEGRGTLEHNELYETSYPIIAIKSAAHPIVRRNRIHHGRSGGVYVYDGGQGEVEDNDIYDNAKWGVEIESGGSPTIRHNRIHRNQGAAIWIHSDGGGIVEDNDLRWNGRGPSSVSADSRSRLRYQRNQEC